MPAVTVANPLDLPRIPIASGRVRRTRPVRQIVVAHKQLEGAGFEIFRPFPGPMPMRRADPFLLLDQAGPTTMGPGETAGAPWHPHRGFETVTYVMDGELVHHDSNGGGGIIAEGDTQWMTAGAGILHDELPSARAFHEGGPVHGVQLWVNLPAALKMTSPRYQAITGERLRLLTSADGGALIRIIAGNVGEFVGPGLTQTPITYLHATLAPGARLVLPWNPAYNAMAYVLSGKAEAGKERRPVLAHQLAVFGAGDSLALRASDRQPEDETKLEVMILGGLPINEPLAHHGPFVMNTRREIEQALDDYNAGRIGAIPADQREPRKFA